MLPFRVLRFSDLTAEGSYPLGGAVAAVVLIGGGSWVLALCLAMAASAMVGGATSLIALRLRVNPLLAGIVVATILYSVNLRLMGQPNLSLWGLGARWLTGDLWMAIGGVFLVGCLMAALWFGFLRSEHGLRFRTAGMHPVFARRQAIPIDRYCIFGLMVANGWSGLAGALAVQWQGYMDMGMGVGIVLHALAAVMLGDAILGSSRPWRVWIAPLIGAIVYQYIQLSVLTMGLLPSDLKGLTGLLVIAILALRRKQDRASWLGQGGWHGS
jgi:putative ABC transport system permease protein